MHFFDVFVGELSDSFGGNADDEPAVWKNFAFRHERASADQTIPADGGTVQDNGLDADQRPIADGATVQHPLMPDGYIYADSQRKAGVCMEHRVVLDVAAVADLDPIVVAANDRAGPDADMFAQNNFADYCCSVSNVSRIWNAWRIVAELIDGHDQLCNCCRKKSSVFAQASLAASG